MPAVHCGDGWVFSTELFYFLVPKAVEVLNGMPVWHRECVQGQRGGCHQHNLEEDRRMGGVSCQDLPDSWA